MSKFIKLPVELQVPGPADAEGKPTGSAFKIVELGVRSGAVLGVSPAQDAPEGSTGKTVVYFTADAGMKPVTSPLSGDEVMAIAEAAD